MASGISVQQECVDCYLEQKTGHKYRLITYMINPEKTGIVVCQKYLKETDTEECLKKSRSSQKAGCDTDDMRAQFEAYQKKEWESLVSDETNFPPKDSRWITADLSYVGKGNTYNDKVVLISWCPDDASIGRKMIAASSIDAFKKKLTITAAHLQANDYDDIKYENVIAFLEAH